MIRSQGLAGPLFRRPVRFLLVGLVTRVLSIGPALLDLPASQASPAQPSNSAPLIPIEEQPFYPQLVTSSETWSDVVLDQVVGDSPRSTLLNFYAVMADVGLRADRLGPVSYTHLTQPTKA